MAASKHLAGIDEVEITLPKRPTTLGRIDVIFTN